MERLDRTAIAVIKVALDRQPLTEAKVAFAWAIAAGPALARAGSVTWADGRLTVMAKSEAWHRELERARPLILQRLRQLLGPDAVRENRLVTPTTETRAGSDLTGIGRERPLPAAGTGAFGRRTR